MMQYAPKQPNAPGAVAVSLIAPHGPNEDRAFAALLSAALDPVSASVAEGLAKGKCLQVTSMTHLLTHPLLVSLSMDQARLLLGPHLLICLRC